MNQNQYSLIITGEEILLGKRQDKHFSYITRAMSAIGFECAQCVILGDQRDILTNVVKNHLRTLPVVIVTGGLGPTLDDITREALSDATGIPLEENPEALKHIKAIFRRFGRPMTDNNRRQALTPTQGTFLPNPFGTAPGLLFDLNTQLVFALPGPPRELEPMVENHMIPIVRSRFKTTDRVQQLFNFCCLGESNIDLVVREKLAHYPGLLVSSISKPGGVELTLSFPSDTEPHRQALKECASILSQSLGDFIYTNRYESPQAFVGSLLKQRGETVAVAESCTGGMLGALFTETPGSSDYFVGGIISYTNDLKTSLLGVSKDTLTHYGAVSEATAKEMACGIVSTTNSDWGIAITGIAGPAGGTEEKPVGTVWVAVAGKHRQPVTHYIKAPGTRDSIRIRSCAYATDLLRRVLLGLPLEYQ